MIGLILSIIFWCIPKNKTLGICAIVFTIIGFVADIWLVGILAIVDLPILTANVVIYNKSDKQE